MTFHEFQSHVVGKVFLIGLTFCDADNNVLEQYQTSGVVERLTDEGLLIFRRKDGNLYAMPYDHECIKKAEKGTYTEHLTGNIIVDPDYIMIGTVEMKDPAGIEKIKNEGFFPVDKFSDN